MIDIKTGRVDFDGGYSIGPSTTVSDLRIFANVQKGVENGCWKTFNIRKLSIDGVPVALAVQFKEARIWGLVLVCITAEHLSWGNYLEEKPKIKVANGQLFERLFGGKGPYRFSWGDVESGVDSKTDDAEIVFRYK